MNRIITIIKKIFPIESPKILGRWKINYCNKKMDTKIDLANEDHCGPCGQYAMSKKTQDDKYVNDVKYNNTKKNSID